MKKIIMRYVIVITISVAIVTLITLSFFTFLQPYNYVPALTVKHERVKKGSLTCKHLTVLKDLENKGILLTAQEYTANITSYYNTLISVLVGLFVLFTIGTLWGFRFTANKEIEEAKEKIKEDLANSLKDSITFHESITNDILGKIEDSILNTEDKKNIEHNTEKIKEIKEYLGKLEDNLSSLKEKRDYKSNID